MSLPGFCSREMKIYVTLLDLYTEAKTTLFRIAPCEKNPRCTVTSGLYKQSMFIELLNIITYAKWKKLKPSVSYH